MKQLGSTLFLKIVFSLSKKFKVWANFECSVQGSLNNIVALCIKINNKFYLYDLGMKLSKSVKTPLKISLR